MVTPSQKRVAEYEWGYAGTRSYMGQPVTLETTTPSGAPVPTPVVVTGYTTVPTEPEAPEPSFEQKKMILIPSKEPSQAERAGIYLESGGTKWWSPFTKQIEPTPEEMRKQEMITRGGASITPAAAHKLGFISSAEAARAASAGSSIIVRGVDLLEAEKAYKEEQQIQGRVTALRTLAKEDMARYLGLYYTSAWGSGILTAAGISAKTIGQPVESWLKKEPMSAAGERELREFAVRTLRFEREPAKTTGMGMMQAPLVAGGSYVLGILGAKAALYSDIAGKAFSIGTKGFFTGLAAINIGQPLVERQYAETIGRGAEMLGTVGLGYEPYKAGVTKQLEVSYVKEHGVPKIRVELAEKAGGLAKEEVRPYREVLKEVSALKKGGTKLRRTTFDILMAQKEKTIIGGSSAARAQVESKIPADIDVYVKNVGQFKSYALAKYRQAGLDVTAKGSELYYKGTGFMHVHTTEYLTGKTFYKGEIESPEGLKLMDVRGQFYRKAVAIYEEPTKKGRLIKDIPDLEKMVRSVIRTGTIKAEESPPILRQFREAKVSSTEKTLRMFVSSTKGYAAYEKPSTPAIPFLIIPYQKTEKTREFPKQYIVTKPFKAYAPERKPSISYTPTKPTKKPSMTYKPSITEKPTYAPAKRISIPYTPAPVKKPSYALPPYKPTKKPSVPKASYTKYEERKKTTIKAGKEKRYVSYKKPMRYGRVRGILRSDLLSLTLTGGRLLAKGRTPIGLHPRSHMTKYREFIRSAGLRIPTAQMLKWRRSGRKTKRRRLI